MPAHTKIVSLKDAFVVKLKSLYDAETEIAKALPKLVKAATDPELRTAFEEHLEETKNHASRIEEAFDMIGMKPGKTQVEAVRGLAADADRIVKEKPGKEALDSMLIAAASYVEHYEIAGYTAAIKWAHLLGYEDAAAVLEETLKEEEAADDRLQSLADEGLDERALNMADESEAEDDTEDSDMDDGEEGDETPDAE